MGKTRDELRRDPVAALNAAVAAVQPEQILAGLEQSRGGGLQVLGTEIPAVPGRTVVAAIGKAAPGCATAWLDKAPHWADEIIVLAPHGAPVPSALASHATVLHGAHPVPDTDGMAAARYLLQRVADLGEPDLLVVLLSGGASALLAAPVAGIELADVAAVTSRLLRSGASITAVNTVRRHLLVAAGGGLARAAAPARVITLVLSDVIGDPLPSIGSGPTVPSPTTAVDALTTLDQYLLPGTVPARVQQALAAADNEPAAPPRPDRNLAQVIGNNRCAVEVAAEHLRQCGYAAIALPQPLTGEAAQRGRQLAALAAAARPQAASAIVLGGETTVTVRGTGRGGRNQELALAAALHLEGAPAGAVLLAAGTDGIDGMSPHAGAVVDGSTCRRARRAGVDPATALADNNSAAALAAAGDALTTGPTGTNVNDLTILLLPAGTCDGCRMAL